MERLDKMHDMTYEQASQDQLPVSEQERSTMSASTQIEGGHVTDSEVPEPVLPSNEPVKDSVEMEADPIDTNKVEEESPAKLCADEHVRDSSSSESKDVDNRADNIEHAHMPTCKKCGRFFNSDRALYGHMRLHSDKTEKNETKDHEASASIWSLSDSKPKQDHTLKWSITGRRGRGRGRVRVHPYDLLCPCAKEAVDNLMLIKFGKKGQEKEDPNIEVENTGEVETSPVEHKDVVKATTNLQTGDDEEEIDSLDAQGVKTSTIETPEVGICQLTSDAIASVESDMKIMENRGNSAQDGAVSEHNGNRMENRDAVPEANRIKLEPSNGSHLCHICNKSFPTHQALGGHMASHTKGKHKQDECSDQTLKRSKKKAGDSEHQCKICGALYPTGQSLGGHMRAHYEPNKGKQYSKSSLQEALKDNKNDVFTETSAQNAIEEFNQLFITRRNNEASSSATNQSSAVGEVLGETPGAALPETDQATASSVRGSAQSSTGLMSAAAPRLDLNEMPDCEEDDSCLSSCNC